MQDKSNSDQVHPAAPGIDQDCRAGRALSTAAIGARGLLPWISVEDQRPPLGTECLVWVARPKYVKRPFADVERWDEIREAPVSFSSATIVVGEGWMEYDFEDVSHWIPLPLPPTEAQPVNNDSVSGSPSRSEARPDEKNKTGDLS